MKFPRNAKIFRGQLEVAPVMSVLFLLIIFILLNSSLVYTPGLPLRMPSARGDADEGTRVVVRVSAEGRLMIGEQPVEEETLRRRLKEAKDESTNGVVLEARAEPEVDAAVLVRLRNMARDSGAVFEAPGASIHLPEGMGWPVAPGPVVVVAVNLGGQIYHENRLVTGEELRTRLARAVARSSGPLTMVIMADQHVERGMVDRLIALGDEVGIREFLMATRPPPRLGLPGLEEDP
ncbi:MAG TPA: biopolymer transporter ExbD [Methylomirabilota bacterium]|nr:biopolymer transporter ExbD [Methylomirabilota bacterium]